MKTTIRKWGNSLAVRLPLSVTRELNIEDGATVSLVIENNALTIRPARKRYELAELLKGVSPEMRRGETDWGSAKGKEVW